MNIRNVFGPLTTTPKQTVPVIHNASSKLDDIFLRLLQQNTMTEENRETFQKKRRLWRRRSIKGSKRQGYPLTPRPANFLLHRMISRLPKNVCLLRTRRLTLPYLLVVFERLVLCLGSCTLSTEDLSVNRGGLR